MSRTLSSGGTTLQQPGITRPLIVPYALCCSGCGINDTDSDGICDDDDNCTNQQAINYNDSANEDCVIPGCLDPTFMEYNEDATEDDGSCSTLIVEGCTNPAADNYDATANTDDDSCIIYGCMDPAYIEYNPAANTFNDGCSTLVVEGCMDPAYTEYNASANTDDGSCATLASTCDRLRWTATLTVWWRSATNAGLRRTCVRRCMLMARLYRKRPTILHGQG